MIIIDTIKKVVVVTGASSGIGKAVSKLYIENGYLVCGIDVNPIEELDQLERYICDISDEDNVKRVFDSIKKCHERINYLINCAGIFYGAKRLLIENLSVCEWEKINKINLTGNMIVTKNTIPLLRNAEGDKAIVNISSDQAVFPRKKNSAYAVTKAGIENFTRACAVELLESRIRANCILPASVRSNFIKKMVNSEEKLKNIFTKENEKMPLGIIEPYEVAELVYFLGSEKAAKITGQSILMDSGLYI